MADLADALRGKSLLIFDDGLRSSDGHWFEYDRAVAEIHRESGASVTILANAQLQNGERDALAAASARVLAAIPRSVWTGDGSPKSGVLFELFHIFSLGRAFARVIGAAIEADSYDCVFVPNARIHDVCAWWLLKRSGAFSRVDRVVLLFRFGLSEMGADGEMRFARKLGVWKVLLNRLRREIDAGKLVLVSDSSRLSSEYSHVGGVDPGVISSPRIMRRETLRKAGEGFVFAVLGAARIEKGIDLLQSAIRKLLASGLEPGVNFLIQWNRPVPVPGGGFYEIDEALEASGRVKYVKNVLSSEDYDSMFDKIDCMVLPYRRAMYNSQISGVAVEAICAGIPIIYTADSWMEDFVTEYGVGVAMRDGSVDDLTSAIKEIASNRSFYTAQARERSRRARDENGASAFLRKLWGVREPCALGVETSDWPDAK